MTSSTDLTPAQLADLGFHLFPLVPGTKRGGKGWPSQATTDKSTIKAWVKEGHDFGIATGKSNLIVIDLDTKRGIDGPGNWEKVKDTLGCTEDPAFQVTTPSGGTHLYFRGQAKTCSNTFQDALGAPETGIDVRSTGGLVVAPGTPGYTVTANSTELGFTSLPPRILNAIGSASVSEKTVESVVEDLDTPESLTKARAYLANEAPEFVPGSLDATCYAIAAMLKDFGLSADFNYSMICDWAEVNGTIYDDNSYAGIEKCVLSAYRTGQNPIGSKTDEGAAKVRLLEAQAVFSVGTTLPDDPPANPRLTSQSITPPTPTSLPDTWTPNPVLGRSSVLSSIPPRSWVIQNRLLRRYISAIIAPGGVGKSTLAFIDALSICSYGTFPGLGDPLKSSGPVAIYNAEDSMDELRLRLHGIAQAANINLRDLPHEYYLISGRETPLRLVSQVNGKVSANHTVINQLVSWLTTHKVAAFYVDPLVRLHNCQENDNMAMDAVAEALTAIAHRANCAVCIVHHSKKMNQTSGAGDQDSARGASSVISAVRLAHTLTTMTEKEAESYGIDPERRSWYVRLDDAKINLAPPTSSIRWLERESVTLQVQPEEDGSPATEQVGTLVPVELARVEPPASAGEHETCEMWAIALADRADSGHSVTAKEAISMAQEHQPVSDATIRRWLNNIRQAPWEGHEGWVLKYKVVGKASSLYVERCI